MNFITSASHLNVYLTALLLLVSSLVNASSSAELGDAYGGDDMSRAFNVNDLFTKSISSDVCSTGDSKCDMTGIIRQTMENAPVDKLTGISCRGFYPVDENNDGLVTLYTSKGKWARCFIPKKEGCSQNVVVDSVVFGVEQATGNVALRVSVYKDCGCLFGKPGTMIQQLIGSASLSVSSGDDLKKVTVNIADSSVVIAPSEAIRVEVEQLEDGLIVGSDGNPYNFFPGSTNSGASGATFITDCNSNTFIDLSDVGRPDSHFILEVQTRPTVAMSLPLRCCSEELCKTNLEVCNANLENCILKPECMEPPLNSCSFYEECAEVAFECGASGYPIKFGDTMCKIYLENDLKLSAGGNAWSRDVRKCLQDALVPVIMDWDCYTCATFETFAFESHVPCYVNSGFCDRMTLIDYGYLVWWTKGALITSAADDIIVQFLLVLKSCGNLFLNSKYAAVIVEFEESLNSIVDSIFDGVKGAFENIVFNEIFKPLLPPSDLPNPYYIWDMFEGSTKVILMIVDDGINNPESVAKGVADGLKSSTGGSLNLTYVSSSTCVSASCKDLLVNGPGDGTGEKKCRLFCRIFKFLQRIFG